MKVNSLLFLLILLIIPNFLFAQKHDLEFYIEQAKGNSTYIHQNQNAKQLVQLDIEQIRKIYSKPEVTVDASVLFAPIVSRDLEIRISV